MLKLWEVEEINQWKRFSKCTIAALREEHRVAQSGLQVWLDFADKQISRDSVNTRKSYRKEQETFGSAQMDLDFVQEDGALDEESDDDSTMTDDNNLPSCGKLLPTLVMPRSSRADRHASWHGAWTITFHEFPSSTMPPKAAAKKRCPTQQNAKPGQKSNHNPCLQPDSSQLGLQEEYTQTPLSYSGFLTMIEGHKEDEEDDKEEEDDDNDNEEGPSDQCGPCWEGYPGPSWPYEWSHSYGAPQESQLYEWPQNMRYDSLPPSTQAGINLPGIWRVFVYNPRRHPTEGQRGQLIMTGVIRPMTEVSVTVPIPSQWQLPPPFRPASPILPSSHAGPAPHLTAKEAKEVMKEVKKVMHRMVLLGSAMYTTERNTEVVEQAFLEAAGRVVPAVPASQIPDRVELCKKLLTITTTVQGVFKKEARRVLPNHYSFTLEARDSRSLTDYREAIVAPLLINHAYLFKDSTIMSPVDHPAVIETIYHALWTTTLHEALDFDELDNLNDLFSIGGTAVHNTLLEFEGGIYKSVAFSPASSSAAEYKAIQSHNTMIYPKGVWPSGTKQKRASRPKPEGTATTA
ncbi:hypothetical protein DFH29DRAFT_875529 [Suillus ampliporus]|nr:hypothetical protein DFH29DRAFT_875529 [Suillus ampliporus]